MITDFLKTPRSKEELKCALEVLREFKGHESHDEWYSIPSAAWAKLEQLEEFLEHLVEDSPLCSDTIEYMKRFNQKQKHFQPPISGKHLEVLP